MRNITKRNNYNNISALLRCKCNINRCMDNDMTPIMYSVSIKDLESTRLLISNKCNMDKCDKSGNSLLLKCNGSEEMMRLLIKGKINVNHANHKKQTPLMCSIIRGYDIEIVELLLSKRANVNAKDQNGNNCMVYVKDSKVDQYCKMIKTADFDVENPLDVEKSEKIMELLVAYGIDINNTNDKGETQVIIASRDNSLNKLRFMIDNKADVNIKNKKGKCAIKVASELDAVKILLLDGYADASPIMNMDTEYSSGRLAMICRPDLIDVLLTIGLDPMVYDKRNLNMLMYTIRSPKYREMLPVFRRILALKVDIDKPNNRGFTPLMEASRSGKTTMIRELLIRGALVDAVDNDGYSPAMWAMYSDMKQSTIDKLLLRKEPLHKTKTSKGKTPLMIACGVDDYKKVLSLIDAKSDLNRQDMWGNTALIYSARHVGEYSSSYSSRRGMSQVLMSIMVYNKADLNIINKSDKDCLLVSYCHKSNEKKCYITDLLRMKSRIDNVYENGCNILMRFADMYKEKALKSTFNDILTHMKKRDDDYKEYQDENKKKKKKNKKIKPYELDVLDINSCDNNGNTALHHVVMNSAYDYVKPLLEYRADPQIENTLNITPLKMAEESNKKIFKIIKSFLK